MNAHARTFEGKPAVRADDPLLIGMIGPPGGGKTYSALRVAKGMQDVRSGDIVVLDTEGGRARKYADDFRFIHVPFDPPYRPSDFLSAIQQWHARKPAAIIVDSMSDEHEGDGGVLDWHSQELDRMAGDDWAKRERVAQAAWIKPKRDRVKMMNGLLRVTTPLIFCFRAREKTKQMKNERGRMEPVNLGYQPIAPAEIVFGLDLTCILPPRAEGVPTWKSDKAGEDFIIKLPRYLAPFITDGKALSEDMGRAFATWARGGSSTPRDPGQAAAADRPAPLSQQEATTESGASSDEDDEVSLTDLDERLAEAAAQGTAALQAAWKAVAPRHQQALKAALDRRHKPAAVQADQQRAQA